jgi:hypothetical protein
MFQLYDFAFSHYCEKARWALHFKGSRTRPTICCPDFTCV